MFRIDEILPFLFADYKFKIIGNQTRQSLNTPVQNTTFFRKQFFSNMLVIFSAFLNLLFGKNSLSAKESIASVIIWNDILSFGSISREISAEISCLKKLVFFKCKHTHIIINHAEPSDKFNFIESCHISIIKWSDTSWNSISNFHYFM